MDVNPQSTDAWFARLDQRLTSQDVTLERIEKQVKVTNGRVSALEQWRASLKAKKGTIIGAIIAVATVIGWFIESGGHIVFQK